jgi:hypothetical protein
LWSFVAAEAVAFVCWVLLARHAWFFADEWDFLAQRRIGSLDDLLRSHYGHWSTAPIVVYRTLWTFVGLRSYVPYLMVVVSAHLACAALLRIVMRRAGVDPWIATTACAAYAFFGTGYQNIVWGFQIGFDMALGFGLVALIAADVDGALTRRDAIAGGAAAVALASSGVGVAMAGIVALTVFLRRGWRVAIAYVCALGALYATWFLPFGRSDAALGAPSPADLARFVRSGIAGAFVALTQLTGLGWVLALLSVAGVAVMLAERDRLGLRRRYAPLSMAVGAPVFLVLSGYQRVANLGPDYARASRYQHVVVALLLPGIAVALDALARRWRPALPILAVVPLLGIPGNIDRLATHTRRAEPSFRATRLIVAALPLAPLASQVSPSVRPLPENPDSARVTIGWLRSASADDRLPRARLPSPRLDAEIALRLSIRQHRGEKGRPTTNCHRLTRSEPRHLQKGQTIVFREYGMRVTSGGVSLSYHPYSGEELTVEVGQLDVVLTPPAFLAPIVCDPA